MLEDGIARGGTHAANKLYEYQDLRNIGPCIAI